jgi:hypothetical protein
MPVLEYTEEPEDEATGHVRDRVLPLVVKGISLEEIRRTLKIPTVDRTLTYLRWALKKYNLPAEQVEELRAVAVATCEEVKRQAFDAFSRSCNDAVTRVTKTDEKGKIVVTETRKGQAGNAAYLRVILEAIKREASLLGLDMPKKLDITKDERLQVLETVIYTREQMDLLQGPTPNAPQIGNAGATETTIDVPSSDPAAS